MRNLKFEIIALDIDGVLMQNSISSFLGDGTSLWLGKKPWLKKAIFRLVEICEFIFGIKHRPNIDLINFLKSYREDNSSVRFFILTDRSLLGLRNIMEEISSLNLTSSDFIQIRGKNTLREELVYLEGIKKEAEKSKDRSWTRVLSVKIKTIKNKIEKYEDDIKKSLHTKANIIFSSAIKPHCEVLSYLRETTSDKQKVLITDNDQNFLRVANSQGFSTFPDYHCNQGRESMFIYFLQKFCKK